MASTDFWRSQHLLLDPWGGDYDIAVQLGEGDAVEQVDTDIDGDWVPRHPHPELPLPERLVFIDGRRRLDARLVGRRAHDNAPFYGAFATLGVGAVVVDRSARKAWIEPPRIRRMTAVSADQKAPALALTCPFGGKQVVEYEASLTGKDNGPMVPMMLVQTEMLHEETRLARELADASDPIVIRDGPLRGENARGQLLGYIKTLHRSYLPLDRASILWQLPVGARTPIFSIGSQGSRDYRWSWYLRSAQIGRSHGLVGVVRMEVSATVSLEHARTLADQTALLIPTYASQPHRDPRAPQNLTPVGGLEREIGRHMGDSRVLLRRISHFLTTNGGPE